MEEKTRLSYLSFNIVSLLTTVSCLITKVIITAFLIYTLGLK